MNETTQHPDDLANAFEPAFARLQAAVDVACAAQPGWPTQVAAAIRAALEFCAADPAAAQTLTNDALAAGKVGYARYDRLIAYLGERLAPGRDERPENTWLPAITERAMAGGIAMLIAQRLDMGRAAELPALAPEAIQFVLTPYLGAAEARRVAEAAGG